MTTSIAIVITTRNRPDNLETLLKSIKDNSKSPKTVMIVSSGENVDNVLRKYKSSLNIIHEHIKVSNQFFQKQIALQKTTKNHDLILFLDDYDILDKNFIHECIQSFNDLDLNVAGMGVTVSNYSVDIPKFRFFRKKIFNYSDVPGSVLKSGNAMPYQNSPKFSRTNWLNGTSVWRSMIFEEFTHTKMASSYSAAEDLIFSYPISKKYKLLTNSDLKIKYGKRKIVDKQFFTRNKSTNLHKLFFIEQHPELSKFWFYVNLYLSTTAMLISFIINPNRRLFYSLGGNLVSIMYLIYYEFLTAMKLLSATWLTSQK
jgi:glycosyltransferase involved in cell wall biosynthesis